MKYVRPFLNSISKAKAARLVRSLLDLFLDMEAATGQEVELCLECIEWAKAEKRTFLRQALEVRLCSVTGLVEIKWVVQHLEPFFLFVLASENGLFTLKWHLITAPRCLQLWVFLSKVRIDLS